jgi:LPS-assembly protein
MFRLLFIFLLLVSYINAKDIDSGGKVEVYATSMDTKDNIVKAYGDVVVIYKDYHLSAKKAIYDRNTGLLELMDNVRASKGDNIQLLGDYAKLNIADKERSFKPFYMLEKTSNVWMSGCESYAKDIEIQIKSGVMSGCDPLDPLWTMEFSSADYNTQSMWLDLYNARVYIYDIPVFYTPYFGYSLDRTRRTGLLPPMVGFSNDEGAFYQQSLYIAESNWWDLELTPQIRSTRGSGIYSTFRFVDSKYSRGEFTYGYFKENDKYFNAEDSSGNRENDLANQIHRGFNFHYENTDFINQWFGTKLKGQSGMYVDIMDMNDVDYINLSTTNTIETVTATQLISRANFFYNTENNYVGMYMKYYKDLEKDSNAETVQNLPSIQYHNYLTTLLDNHLLYSFDIQANNFHREEGQGATQTDLNLPISLQTSLFDEYMNISYTAYLYAQHTSFNGTDTQTPPTEVDDGYFARNYHVISASSQLTRAYDNITHVVDFGSQYIVGGDEVRDGFYDNEKDYCLDKSNSSNPDYASRCEFYNISDIEENMQLYFSQYLYDDLGKQIIYHRVAQSFSYGNVNAGAGEIENELDYTITDNINFYNNMFYNHDEGAFSKNFNKISYNNDVINVGLSHMYQEDFTPAVNRTEYTRYMTSSVAYKYNSHYSYNLRFDYDIEQRMKKSTQVGFLYKKRCWDFGLSYIENNRPTLDSTGNASSRYERFIYFTIALKPVMQSGDKSSGFIYKLPESGE